jgi:hypothetical protein
VALPSLLLCEGFSNQGVTILVLLRIKNYQL